MAQMARKYGVRLNLIETTITKNDERKAEMSERVIAKIKSNPQGKIAVLGLAFKGGTDDCRESPSMDILKELLKHSGNIAVYDPKAMKNAEKILGKQVVYAKDIYEACNGAEILVILTEWEEFRSLDLQRIRGLMKAHKIVDLRNMLNADEVRKSGFDYSCIGMIS